MAKRSSAAAAAIRRGFTSAFDVGVLNRAAAKRALHESSPSDDRKHMAIDWTNIGQDLIQAAETVGNEHSKRDGKKQK